MPLSLSSHAGPSASGGAMGRVPMLCRPGEQGQGLPGVTACSPSTCGNGFRASPSPESPASCGALGEKLSAG